MDRTPILFVSLALSLATFSLAHADERKEMHGFGRYKDELKEMQRSLSLQRADDIEGCDDLVAEARKAGLTDDTRIDIGVTYPDGATFGEMQAMCKEFADWHHAAEAKAVLEAGESAITLLDVGDMEQQDEDNKTYYAAAANDCNTGMDKILADGVPVHMVVDVGGKLGKIEIGDGKAKVCGPLMKRAGSFAKDVKDARAKDEEERFGPYKKIGVKGDRLRVLGHYNNAAIRGIGGGELRTPNAKKAASVFFVTLGPSSDDGTYIVTRYAFKGDTLVSQTDRKYILQPGAKAYR
jgi:hypothetical protein